MLRETESFTEAEERLARAMREAVFEKECSDANWIACREYWIRTYRLFVNKTSAVEIKAAA
jgi:hypothetical protein